MNVGAHTDLLDHLDRRTVVVTAGQRLARHLTAEYAARQRARGRSAWERPAILPWAAWLEQLWLELSETGATDKVLLTSLQELALWERLIEEWDAPDTLLAPAAAARTAQEAWQLAHAWRLPPQAHAEASEDTRVFAGWAARYREECERHGWLDEARLPDELAAAVRARRLVTPSRLVLAGFDELTPQQEEFLQTLGSAGCVVVRSAPPAAAAPRAVRIGFETERSEETAMAQWLRSRLSAHPAARIAVVVPDLAARRAAILRAIEDALVPAAVLPGEGTGRERPFNISLGVPLADEPLVHAALAILRLGTQARRGDGRLDLLEVSLLLRSPFLGAAEAEYAARGALDAHLRAAREPYLLLSPLIESAKERSCPKLAEALRAWRALLDALPRRQSAGRWAAAFAALVRALGWPGERSLSSAEFQALEAWRGELALLSTLDAVLPAMDDETALHHLENSARHRLFQPQSSEAAVQVLGVLEATGLVFDHLWVMGLHDEAWPPPPNPNPLLPIRLQRERRMPRSSSERELEVARRVTTRLLAAADEVIVSYSLSEADRVRHASPLIAALPEVRLEDLRVEAAMPYRLQIHAAASLETAHDWLAPPFAPGRAVGGTAVIADQSACPFRAYARHRLAASRPEHPAFSLDPADRGLLVHAALEALWGELKTQERLLALDEATCGEVIARATRTALDWLQRRRPFTLGARLRALEQQRLEALLREWLEIERGRAPFTVAGVETRRPLRIGDIELEARVDRVDVLENGARLVIDYKTGAPKVADWFGARPKAPQLPLYSLYGLNGACGGVAYARVKRGECAFHGLARADSGTHGIVALAESRFAQEYPSWPALEQSWRAAFVRLAEEFRQGVASASPRDDEDCRDCEQKPLCRIHELNERRGRFALADDTAPGAADE